MAASYADADALAAAGFQVTHNDVSGSEENEDHYREAVILIDGCAHTVAMVGTEADFITMCELTEDRLVAKGVTRDGIE